MAVMGKASAPGQVKTRLVPPLTPQGAASLNTAFLQDMIGNVISAGATVAIAPYVAFSPASSQQFFRAHLPAGVGLIECSEGHFGTNLLRAIDTLLSSGYGAACVLNADSPTLPTRCLVAAARALAMPGDRVVIGPTLDGGYYLLGVKQMHRRLFEDIDWSTDRVYLQTCQRAAQLGLPVENLESWYDVDDAAALVRLDAEMAAALDGLSWQTYHAQRTRAALRQLSWVHAGPAQPVDERCSAASRPPP